MLPSSNHRSLCMGQLQTGKNTLLAAYPMVPKQMTFLPHFIFDLCHWEILP